MSKASKTLEAIVRKQLEAKIPPEVLNIAAAATGFRFGGADNASISHVVVEADRWRVRCFDDTSHLSPTFSSSPEPLT